MYGLTECRDDFLGCTGGETRVWEDDWLEDRGLQGGQGCCCQVLPGQGGQLHHLQDDHGGDPQAGAQDCLQQHQDQAGTQTLLDSFGEEKW